MKFIQEKSDEASIELAAERGPFPNFYRSIYKDGPPIRNSTRTTIAPTGTISIIADCSSGIEPVFSWAYTHKVGDRELKIHNKTFIEVGYQEGFLTDKVLEKIRSKGGMIKDIQEIPEEWQEVLTPAFAVDVDTHVLMQAAFQKHTDNAVSKTINLANSATVEDVRRAYWLAIESGCLGITIYRDGSKFFQVLNLEADGKKDQKHKTNGSNGVTEPRGKGVLPAKVIPQETPSTTLYLSISEKDGKPFETFINLGKAGSDVHAWAEAVARLLSFALQIYSPIQQKARLKEIARQLKGIQGSQTIGFGLDRVLSEPDAIAIAIDKYLEAAQNGQGENTDVTTQEKTNVWGNLCRECGNNTLVYQEGCYKCVCGYTSC